MYIAYRHAHLAKRPAKSMPLSYRKWRDEEKGVTRNLRGEAAADAVADLNALAREMGL